MSTENEILSEVEALKARFSDNKQLYREVCALLFFRFGITPTTNKLYQYVRKGTMSTPAEALSKFWDELRSKARVDIGHPDLPEDLKAIAAEAIAGIWQQASTAARRELEALRIEAEQSCELAKAAALAAEAAAVQLRVELRGAQDAVAVGRTELETERRTHAGTSARLQEQQAQAGQLREQMQRLQDGFSADLAKAREAVQAADQRAGAAERRALLEIEQERQARHKAESLADTLRGQLASVEAAASRQALENAEFSAKLQARLESLQGADMRQRADNDALQKKLQEVEQQLIASKQEATKYKAQCEAVQDLVQRIGPAQPTNPKSTRRKPAPGG